MKLGPCLWNDVNIKVGNELRYDKNGTRVFQVQFDKDERKVRDGRPRKPWVEKVSVEYKMFNLVAALTCVPTKTVPMRKNLESRTVYSLLDLERKHAANRGSVKGNSYRAVRERLVSIHKIQIMLLFTTLGNTCAQPFANPVYTCKGTLKSFLKQIQW